MPEKTFDIVIFGAGSIGTALAILWSRQGKQVALLGKENPFAKGELEMADEGQLRLRQPPNIKFFYPKNSRKVVAAPAALLVLATKTVDLEEVCQKSLVPILSSESSKIVLALQNGISPETIVEKVLVQHKLDPNKHLVGAIVQGRAEITRGKKIDRISFGFEKIVIGSWKGFEKRRKLMKKSSALLQLVAPVTVTNSRSEYAEARLSKAILNSANSVCATLGARVGEVIENKAASNLLIRKCGEALTVSNKLGARISKRNMRKRINQVYRTLVYAHRPSMAQDIILSIENPKRLAQVEVSELDLAFFNLGARKKYYAKYNRFFGEYLEELCRCLNYLKAKAPESACQFGMELLDLNRKTFGLKPIFGVTTPPTLAYKSGVVALQTNLLRLMRKFKIPAAGRMI